MKLLFKQKSILNSFIKHHSFRNLYSKYNRYSLFCKYHIAFIDLNCIYVNMELIEIHEEMS